MNNKDFVQLHNHTEFSLLDGAQTVKRFVAGAKEKGYRYLAVTDHGNLDGIIKFNKECKFHDIKPVFGCELYMLENWKERDNLKLKQRNLHLTVQAKNFRGLQALFKSLGFANLEGGAKKGYAWRPFLPIDHPLTNKEWHGNVIIQTGCGSSPFWNAANGLDLLKSYKDVYGDDFYAEMMPLHDLPSQVKINELAELASKQFGIKPICTSDSHYLENTDHRTHEVILAISQHGIPWNHPKRWKFDSKLNYLRDASESYASLRKMGLDRQTAKRAIYNTLEIGEKSSFDLPKLPIELPRILDEGIDETNYLIEKCASQLKRKGLDKPEYWSRLETELDAILEGGFVRYFLMVADLMKWAKKNSVLMGPGRGSSGGSLVAYLLGITGIDPLPYNLVFERFISVGRADLPDIDIDVEDRKRHLVEAYLRERYGYWNVAHISTFGEMKGKQAIRDVSRIFQIPRQEADKVARCILVRPDKDSRSSYSILDTVKIFDEAKKFKNTYPHVIKHASKIEGQIKTLGIHAAGFVVSNKDLRESGNCYLAKRRGFLTVNWDKEDLEQMGLIKLDVLGLATLSVLSDARDLVHQRHGKLIDFNKLPLDDKKTFDQIKTGNTVCGFQIGSKGLQKFCRDLRCDDLKTLVDAIALWRPGPLKAGMPVKYVNCRLGKEKPKYYGKVHKKIVGDTFGQIIYQEQIMFLLNEMAGIPWAKTDEVRKTIGRKENMEKWKEYKKMFAKGCSKMGTMKYDEAVRFFDELRYFCQYGFNMAHAVEYGIVGYWCVGAKTKVYDKDEGWIHISKAYKKKIGHTLCLDDDGNIRLRPIKKILKTGKKKVYRLSVSYTNYSITCTKEHKFWTENGWKPLKDLKNGDKILIHVPKDRYGEEWGNRVSYRMKKHWRNLNKVERQEQLKGLSKHYKSPIRFECAKLALENRIKNGNLFNRNHKNALRKLHEQMQVSGGFGFGKYQYAKDGHPCYSNLEAKLERFLIKYGIRHKPHPKIEGTKFFADQLVDNWLYVEVDGMNRSDSYFEKRYGHLPYIVIRPKGRGKIGFRKLKDLLLIEANSNFKKTKWVEVKSIKYVGEQNTYDISMDVEKGASQNYLANHFVTHNTIYMKANYPTEFICSYLNYGSISGKDASSDEEKLDVVLQEAKRLDIKILPPDINKSGELWSIAGDHKLRAGIGTVRNAGDTIVKSLSESREKVGGKFNSFEHFIESVDRRRINKRVIKSFLFSGALDRLFVT